MGSHNSFFEGGSHLTSERKTKICMLINAVYFFLESVFIVVEEEHCRLVVIHNRKLIVDECYDTIRGAKIAFYRMYKEKACAKGLRNEWSANYEPDKRWLSKKLESQPQPIYQDKLLGNETMYAAVN